MHKLVFIVSLLFFQYGYAQKSAITLPIWTVYTPQNKANTNDGNTTFFQLNFSTLQEILAKVPATNNSDLNQSKTILTFPFPNGEFYDFLIEETTNFHPDLADQFPNIKSYKGRGLENPKDRIYFDISPKGLNVMIQSIKDGLIFIDNNKDFRTSRTQSSGSFSLPKKANQPNDLYQVYTKEDLPSRTFTCETFPINRQIQEKIAHSRNNNSTCELRTFRLALGCTGEYAQYHGGTTESVLAAMNTTLTILNGIFEIDLGISLQLIPSTPDLIFMDAATDPYTNTELSEMLSEHQDICDQIIGAAHYDLGHVFGTGLGGVAFLGVICQDNFKGGAATGFPNPEGPTFAIDLVAHEIGHQFGANHTFNGDQVACSGSNRNNATAVEPGSGSTIMGYAGICSPQNVQANSDAYFHAISIEQMQQLINENNGCGQTDNTNNNSSPIISTTQNSYGIPISTPFALTANAVDDGSSQLTYTWEQIDNEITPQPPLSNNHLGPMFRSLPPSNSPTRYFPNLKDLSRNLDNKWEVLPDVAREMNFRSIVRDNQISGGCTESIDITIEVINISPFKVEHPNTAIAWETGTQQEIIWTVGSTDQSPINTSKVDILLSFDGGLTYPTILAEGVDNNGNNMVLIPNVATTTARIMIRALDNIYFDISDNNFEIIQPADDFDLTISNGQSVCLPQAAVYEISFSEIGNFTEQINLSIEGLPNGATAIFSNPNPNPVENITLTIEGLNGFLNEFEFTLIAKSAIREKSRTLILNSANSLPVKVNLLAPLNNAGNITPRPEFTWQQIENASAYQFEIAKDIAFSLPIFIEENIKETTFELPQNLENDTKYYWRVNGENACGKGEYSQTSSFETAIIACSDFQPADLPKNISSIFITTVTSTINVPENGKIVSVKIKNLEIEHSFIGDLKVDLQSPKGTKINLFDKICGDVKDLKLNFEDAADISYESIPCPPNTGATVQAGESLAAFNGEEMNGNWELIVRDGELLDGGSVDNWVLEICYQIEKPIVISTNKRAVSCAGGNDGMATVSAEGGSGNYQYLWSNGATTARVDNLSAGIYHVTISDGENSRDTTINIEESPALIINLFSTEEGCIGAHNGAILIDVEGGTAPYNYQWLTGATQANITDLSTGNYRLTVTDNLGCNQIDSFQIDVFPIIELAIDNQINPRCPEEVLGEVSLSNNLEKNLDYQWSNDTSGPKQLLPIGNYTVTATDENGCSDEILINIEREFDTIPPVLNLQSTTIYLDELGLANLEYPTIVAEIFEDCGDANITLSISSFSCENIGSQLIQVKAIDASGNETSEEVIVEILDTIAPVFECLQKLQLIGCQEVSEELFPVATDNCGAVDVKLLQVGEEGFFMNPNILSFKATDQFGNYSFCYVPINRVEMLNVSAIIQSEPLCFGDNTGEILVFPTGGLPPYNYEWSFDNPSELGDAFALRAGNYSVTVTDSTGCEVITELEIEEPDSLEISEVIIKDEINGNSNGSVQINTKGGSGVLYPQWYYKDSFIGIDFILTDLVAGDYKLILIDDKGCSLTRTFVVDLLTGAEELSFVEKLNVFPNPTYGLLNLEIGLAEMTDFTIDFYTIKGQKIKATQGFKIKEKTVLFDLNDLKNGVYFVKFTFEEGSITKRIILLK